MINENIKQVKDNIKTSCMASGRKESDVTLIAVSKTKPVSMIMEAYKTGIRDFGENKVQEVMEKYDKLPSDINWHLIGHLQRNKVKYIIDKVKMIHSVDSVRLAEEINKEALKHNVHMDILLEVNAAEEESKFGFKCDEVLNAVYEISKLPQITIKGLMTIAPYVEDAEENREVFCTLKKILVDIAAKNIDNINMFELSMGMSGDYKAAVEEGATYVRVGTGIFGERNYKGD